MISIFEACAIAAVIIFAILTVYIIRTLFSLQESLKEVHFLTGELKHKMQLMESTFKTISALGEIGEEKVKDYQEEDLLRKDFARKHYQRSKANYTDDFIELILSALKIGSKYFRR